MAMALEESIQQLLDHARAAPADAGLIAKVIEQLNHGVLAEVARLEPKLRSLVLRAIIEVPACGNAQTVLANAEQESTKPR